MPPKGRKNESKEPKGQKDSKDMQKERTDDELKASPTFMKQFCNEVCKHANPDEKKLIESSYAKTTTFDDFTLALFELEWFLEKYEDIFNSAKESMKTLVKKEEPPKIDPKLEQEEYINPGIMRSSSHDYVPPYFPYQPSGTIFSNMKPMGANMDSYSYQIREQSGYSPSQIQQMPQIQPTYNQPANMLQNQISNQKSGQLPVSLQGQIPGQIAPQIMGQTPGVMLNQMTNPISNQMSAQMANPMGTHTPVQMASQIPPHIQPTIQHPIQQQPPTQTTLPSINRNVSEKEDRTIPIRDQQYQTTTEFETNPQYRQKLNNFVPLNFNLLLSSMTKQKKKATDGFYHGLYMSITDYVRNLLDELKNVCEMDLDSGDLKNYMKTGGTNEMEGEKSVLMGGMEGESEYKTSKQSQYLVKFSSFQEDQKQIEKLDDREQKDLEDKYTLSKDDDEEKITKKVKKDFTEEDEIIKFLFKTKKDKGQDNENMTKKIQETNLTISNLTSRTYSQPKTIHTQDPMSQREASGKGRKSTAFQKRVTMKHLIYYLETNPQYKRSPLLHKAYLK